MDLIRALARRAKALPGLEEAGRGTLDVLEARPFRLPTSALDLAEVRYGLDEVERAVLALLLLTELDPRWSRFWERRGSGLRPELGDVQVLCDAARG